MNNLNIFIKMQNIPMKDKELSTNFLQLLQHLSKKKSINLGGKIQYNNNFYHLSFDNIPEFVEKIKKGPKANNDNAIKKLKEQFPQGEFFNQNGYFMVKSINYNISDILLRVLLDTICQHQWSTGVLPHNACRPIDFIVFKFNNDYISGVFNNILFKKEIITEQFLTLEQKLKSVEKFLSEENRSLFVFLLNKFGNPHVHLLNFHEKYLEIPRKIIKYFLFHEQLAVCLDQNQCLVLSDNKTIDKKAFEFSLDAKLFDLLKTFQRDMSYDIDYYIHKRDNFFISKEQGFYKDKIKRMELILKQIELKSLYLKYFHLDIVSEIVQEAPDLQNTITKCLIPNYIEEKEVIMASNLDDLILFAKINELPTGKRDPFGLKKKLDFIVEFIYHEQISLERLSIPGNLWHLIKQKQLHFLNNKNIHLKYLNISFSQIKPLEFMEINKKHLERLIGLFKIPPTQNIPLNQDEIILLEKIKRSGFDKTQEIISDLIKYVDSVKISESLSRYNIIETFLNKFINHNLI